MFLNRRGIGLFGFGLSAWLGLGLALPAQAAPQALALVSTEGDVTLACAGGECGAEMPAFCLQQDRLTPTRGTRYDMVAGSDLVLKGVTRDGREIVLDGAKYLRFRTERTHVAVRVSVSEAEMAALGIARVKLNVGVNVALLPEPTANDDRPQREADLLLLTGAMRPLGARVIDFNRKHMVAARLTSRMINALPEGAPVPAGESERLWGGAIQATAAQELPADGIGLARRAVDFCKFAVARRARSSLRECLQSEHDDLLGILNSNYWQAVKTGS